MMTAIISELFIYPLKSAAGIQLEQSPVDKSGLRYDRRWMLIDNNGDFLSQRQLSKMALIQPSLDTQGQLSLDAKGMPTIQVPLIKHSIATLPVVIWNTPLEAQHLSHEVDQWLSDFLNIECKLVTLAENTRRQCDLNYAKQGDHTTFTDGFPLLICTQASLDDLNSRLETKVSMQHFRPNIVITGTIAYEEDLWETLVIGKLSLNVVKPCSRCVVTTIDPKQGIRTGAEPLATLASYRKKENKINFGQNAIPNNTGLLVCNRPITLA